MYKNAVKYKDTWLAQGSVARSLYDEKKWQELDKHLAELDKVWKKMEGRQ